MTRNAQPGVMIRAVREAKGLSQVELGRRARYDAAYVSRVESGKQRPSVPFLLAIGRELGINGPELYRPIDSCSSAHPAHAVAL
jgi:transcriptional regulator with XRE-family HTH domain